MVSNKEFWKNFSNVEDFILYLTEDNSTLKVALKITFQGLFAYKSVSY